MLANWGGSVFGGCRVFGVVYECVPVSFLLGRAVMVRGKYIAACKG